MTMLSKKLLSIFNGSSRYLEEELKASINSDNFYHLLPKSHLVNYIKPPEIRATKIYSVGPGYMTNTTVTPTYVWNFYNVLQNT